mgnify:CR=1 FL=1
MSAPRRSPSSRGRALLAEPGTIDLEVDVVEKRSLRAELRSALDLYWIVWRLRGS